MRYLRWLLLSVVAVVLVACTTPYNPGRCDTDSNCPSGQVCNLAPTPQGNGRCVSPGSLDGGAGDGGTAGAGGNGPDAGSDANTCAACGGNTSLCLQGACVQCLASSDCTAAANNPICDTTTHTCTPCSTDSQCVAKFGATGNPGVCMSQIDGHCATDVEAVYVQNIAGCTSAFVSNQGGTSAAPYCSMDPIALAVADTAHTLVVVRGTVAAGSWTYAQSPGRPETSIVGQQTAVIASSTSPGFSMSGGSVYIRGVTINSAESIGISASGGTIQLDSVVVANCKGGGILLDGAAFNISNTTVTNNGPGTFNSLTTWGGVLINNPPAAGPAALRLVTVQNNNPVGVSCSSGITGTGVLASGSSSGIDISTSCGFASCGTAGPTCGAP